MGTSIILWQFSVCGDVENGEYCNVSAVGIISDMEFRFFSTSSGGAFSEITNMFDGSYGIEGYAYNANKDSLTGYFQRFYDFSNIENITEISFFLGAVSNDWEIKFIYTDETDSGWILQELNSAGPEYDYNLSYKFTSENGKFIKEVQFHFPGDSVLIDNFSAKSNQ